jgi:hypothetical protein
MKYRLLLLTVLAVLLLLPACQNSFWNNYTRIYLNNTTADSFQVFIAYPPSDTTGPFEIKPLAGTKLLSTYYMEDEPNAHTTKDTYFWLYNYTDTSYTLLSNCDTLPEYVNRYHKFLISEDVEVRASNPNFSERILTLTIDSVFLLEMYRDTLLTDSIFGVR